MLKIASDIRDVNLIKLADVYQESNLMTGKLTCPIDDLNAQILYGEEQFYDYTMFFLESPESYYCIWMENEQYVSALRLEAYADGYLLNGLETAPEHRRKGYAERLITCVLEHFLAAKSSKIYSHIDKKNAASLQLHLKCGFLIIADSARFLDGSVRGDSYTLLYQYSGAKPS